MLPYLVDTLFPLDRQRNYISTVQKRVGLTRQRAEYFVRLWAYLVLKYQEERTGKLPIELDQLYAPEELIACTHREAAELFYCNKDRGSDRAAGMMIDRLAALGLIDKRYDGQSLSLQIRSVPELELPKSDGPIELLADAFNPRTDAISVANFYMRNYGAMIRDGAAMSKVARVLRSWSKQYPVGMRVLRRSDNSSVAAAYVLYPVATESELHFFQAPSKSFYLTTDNAFDPFVMAPPGDRTCTSIYVRTWVLDQSYLSVTTLCQMLEDAQHTLTLIRQGFPELCDVYTLIVHPMYDELCKLLGFERICEDAQRVYAWVYIALDRFLEVNLPQALSNLRIGDGAQ